ncbi:unnamed protein product [Orchesella dallaii]|uniref:Secreted protein n=1 Tax=Orchesella dallaii TaxID=48710 RepID=A0ABP1RN49_9HEXA
MFHKSGPKSNLIAALLAFNLITPEHVLGHTRPSFSSEILRNPEAQTKNGNLLVPEHTNHPHTRKGRCFFSASKAPTPQRVSVKLFGKYFHFCIFN